MIENPEYVILTGNEASIILIINSRHCSVSSLTKRNNMEKLEKIFWTLVTIAEVAVVGFWIAGVKGNLELSAVLLFIGGGGFGVSRTAKTAGTPFVLLTIYSRI